MRINPGLGEQQSEWSVSGLQRKIVTDAVEIHHVRKLKDLQGKKFWESFMTSRKRKTLALCHNDSFAQQWSIIRTNAGYKLQSRCNGYYLDVSGGEYAAGTNVWV